MERCDNCEYYRVRLYGDKSAGECRCNPPVFMNGQTRWPRCEADDWCGKWETITTATEREVNKAA